MTPFLVQRHPRSADRGPIEAPGRHAESRASARVIRGQPTAAPLKRSARTDTTMPGLVIRGQPTAAPLKRGRRDAAVFRAVVSSAVSRPRPH